MEKKKNLKSLFYSWTITIICVYCVVGILFLTHRPRAIAESLEALELPTITIFLFGLANFIGDSYVLSSLVIIFPVVLWYSGYAFLKANFETLEEEQYQILEMKLNSLVCISIFVLIWVFYFYLFYVVLIIPNKKV